MESIINNFTKQKAPDLDWVTSKFYQTFRKKLHQFSIIFKKVKQKEYFLTHAMRPRLLLTQNRGHYRKTTD